MKIELQKNLNLFQFDNFEISTLVINSKVLSKNPLGDSAKRMNPILIPANAKQKWPVVFVLAGFTGNGGKYFNQQSFEENTIEVLAKAVSKNQAPEALYVFVDAWTFWGGSQFINSRGCGRYEDYIIKELVPAIKKAFPVSANPNQWAVTGGSSGGYGALHLSSQYPEIFANCGAIAPDCFFEMSLLSEIYSAWPYLKKWGGVKGVKKALQEGKIQGRRESHNLLNAIGMGTCYACNAQGQIQWPIDDQGILNQSVWKKWLDHDPLVFLKKRKNNLKKLNQIYLDTGIYDQFHLQYGTRQLYEFFKSNRVSVNYSEFEGNHFDIGERRIHLWKWLNHVFS